LLMPLDRSDGCGVALAHYKVDCFAIEGYEDHFPE
jgi:hypothetical protein